MTLPASGLITMNQINIELALPATQALNLNDPACRALAGVPSGVIRMSDFYSKRTVDVVQTRVQQTAARVTTTVLSGWTACVAGNLIVIEFNWDGANGPAPAAPAGYTLWPSGMAAGVAGSGFIGIFYKVAAGGETGVNFTHGNSQTCSVMRECFASTIAFAAPVTGTSVNPDPPIISPPGGFKSYLFVAGAIYGTAGVSAYSPGYPIAANGAAAASGIRVASSGKQLTAATENPGAMVLNASAPWGAFTYAVA